MKKLIAILVVILGIVPSQAQEQTWTLEKCIEHAYENNLSIKQMLLRSQMSNINYKQSKEELLPAVRANAGYSYSVGRTLNPITNDFDNDANSSLNLSISADMILFDGMRTINTIKKNKIEAMSDMEAIEKVKRDVSLEIALAFLNIIRTQELLAAAEMQYTTTEKQVERSNKLVQAGSLPEGSLLEIQAQLAKEQASVVDGQNGLMLAKLNLSQLLDLPTADGFEIAKPNIPTPDKVSISVNTADIYGQIENLPEIKQAALQMQSAESNLSIAKSGYSPVLSLSGSISSGYSESRMAYQILDTYNERVVGFVKSTNEQVVSLVPDQAIDNISMADQFRDNRYSQLSINLSIPIYSRGRVRSQISNAKIGILQAQNQMAQTKLGIYKAIQQSLADANAALARYQSTKISVDASSKAFEYTEQKFNVGAINTFEYTQAKSQLFQSQSSLAQAKFDYIFRSKILDFYRGVAITL